MFLFRFSQMSQGQFAGLGPRGDKPQGRHFLETSLHVVGDLPGLMAVIVDERRRRRDADRAKHGAHENDTETTGEASERPAECGRRGLVGANKAIGRDPHQDQGRGQEDPYQHAQSDAKSGLDSIFERVEVAQRDHDGVHGPVALAFDFDCVGEPFLAYRVPHLLKLVFVLLLHDVERLIFADEDHRLQG